MFGQPVAPGGGADGGDGEPAGGHHQRFGVEFAVGGGQHKAAVVAARHAVDGAAQAAGDAAVGAFGVEQVDDLLGAVVAKQLAEGFFVVGDAVAFDQLDKVPLAVLRQRRAHKVRVGGQIALGVDVEIGEVAAAAARDADFFGQFVAVVQHQHAPAALPGHAGAHQAGGAGAHHDYIIRLLCHPGPI